MDSKINFNDHAYMVAQKADEATSRLARIMPNTGCAKSKRRKLLASVTQSILMYGAPVWARHIRRKGWEILNKTNRRMRLKVITAYRTVAKEAVEVLVGMPPTELQAEYRRSMSIVEERKNAEEKMILKWQARWEGGERGRWTRKLIKDVGKWHRRKHGTVDFHLTQALTGHGCFPEYLKRFVNADSEECWFCGHEVDDAFHTLFECDAWAEQRKTCSLTLGKEISPDNLVRMMLDSADKWNAITKYVNEVLKAKEEEERRIEREIDIVII